MVHSQQLCLTISLALHLPRAPPCTHVNFLTSLQNDLLSVCGIGRSHSSSSFLTPSVLGVANLFQFQPIELVHTGISPHFNVNFPKDELF